MPSEAHAEQGSFILSLQKPGWPRRIAVLLLTSLMAAACMTLVFGSAQSEAALALEIFLVSVMGFSFIAALSHDAVLCWRLVEFPWLCISFLAVVVTLLNFKVSHAESEISRSFSTLIYATQSAIINDCQGLPAQGEVWPRSPEPYDGACTRMMRSLPQMTHQYDEFARTKDVSSLTVWAMNVLVPGTSPIGSWAGQYESARRFIEAAEEYGPDLEFLPSIPPSLPQRIGLGARMHPMVQTDNLKYYYYVLAFFVGLHLSKTTAEVLRIRASRKDSLHGPD